MCVSACVGACVCACACVCVCMCWGGGGAELESNHDWFACKPSAYYLVEKAHAALSR